jgi:hypothetical protein
MTELPAFLDPRSPTAGATERTSSPASAPAAPPARPRPDLRLLPAPAPSTRRLPFVLLVVGLLGAGLLGLLLLNTLSAQGAFTVSHLQQRSQQLTDREQALHTKIAQQESAAALARRARSMGMKPAGAPTITHLPGGRAVAAVTARPGSAK